MGVPMRRYFLAACLALGFLMIVPGAFAQQTVTPTAQQTAQVANILAQYPNGGAALAAAITAAVEADPSLSYAVAAASATATPDQQTAMGTGLADAANYFSNLGTAAGTADANEIVAAIATGSTIMIASADAEISPTAGGGGSGGTFGSLATNNTSGSGQTSCVSPSRPGPC